MLHNPHVGRDALARAIKRAPDHLRPIYCAVRDHGCGTAIITQDSGPFAFPMDKPNIVIIGDDLHVSKGPNAFDGKSMATVVAQCAVAFVIASAAEANTYTLAVTWAAVLRRHVVIVETQPKHEDAWVEFLQEAAPGISLVISRADPPARPATAPWGSA